MAQIGEERQAVTMANMLYDSLLKRAAQLNIPIESYLDLIIRSGIDAEQKKGDILREKLKAFRQTSDEADAQRVGDEIGEMIFGR